MIDSHCHLADDAFRDDVAAVVDRARAAGGDQALCILDVTNDTECARAGRLASLWKTLRFAAGVHPHQAGGFTDRLDSVVPAVTAVRERHDRVSAIGEIGLDYHYDFCPRSTQIDVFRRQISLARECGSPIVIHTREADNDTVDAVQAEAQGMVSGVFHCFTGGMTLARQVLDLGFYVSFSGIVTFKRADEVREVAAYVPTDRLLVETDAPYLAPVPYRGKRNEPAWVARVVEVLAEVRGKTTGEIIEASEDSFVRLFGNCELSGDTPKGLAR